MTDKPADKAPQPDLWLRIAMEIQAIAQNGLAYVKDIHDQMRYERLRAIAAEMLAEPSGLPVEKVRDLFCNESGYQTPKLDGRAAIFRDGQILLVREKDGLWALPGGWVDVLDSVGDSVAKEVKEEAGLDVIPKKIIALQDRNRHNTPPYAYGICKIFLECAVLGGAFAANAETTAAAYFPAHSLPPLNRAKTTAAQIALCFAAHAAPDWQPYFD